MTTYSAPPSAGSLAAKLWLSSFKIFAGAVLLLLVGGGLVAARVWPAEVTTMIHRVALAEHQLGASGWLLAFVVQTFIALCGILPASAGAIAVGMAFGTLGGFVISAAATFIGAALAFLLARSLFRPLIARTLSRRPRMVLLDDAIKRDGWRLVVLMRLSPIMPFAVTSYAMGLTSLSMRAYLVGTVASMPALFGYVVLGSIAGQGLSSLTSMHADYWHWALLCLAFIVTAILTFRLARIGSMVLRTRLPSQHAQPQKSITQT